MIYFLFDAIMFHAKFATLFKKSDLKKSFIDNYTAYWSADLYFVLLMQWRIWPTRTATQYVEALRYSFKCWIGLEDCTKGTAKRETVFVTAQVVAIFDRTLTAPWLVFGPIQRHTGPRPGNCHYDICESWKPNLACHFLQTRSWGEAVA